VTLPRSKAALRGRRSEIENELSDTFHVDYEYRMQVPVDDFDIDRSLANQARFQALDEPTVALYQEGVERGDSFPAVIAYRAGRAASAKLVIIDGNHRLVAHERAARPVDVYEIDRGTRAQAISLMTFAFNTKHGRPTSLAERLEHAKFLVDNGASQDTAAAAVNVPLRDLKRAMTKAKSDERAKEVGADPREWEQISQSGRHRLLNVSTDEGFLDAIHLAYIAQLNAEECFELTTLLNTTKSGRKQSQLVKAERERLAERIQGVGGGVLKGAGATSHRAMSPRARLGIVLGQVIALPEDFDSLARAFGESERSESAQRVLAASERLRKLALTIDPSVG
jgi:hypothetical protein